MSPCLSAREKLVTKISATPRECVNNKHTDHRFWSGRVACVIFISLFLGACESSQLLDVSGILSPGDKKTAASPNTEQAKSGKRKVQDDTDTASTNAEENVVLRGPSETASTGSTETGSYPTLTEAPLKPTGYLNPAQKDREIQELKDTGKSHVQDRELLLETTPPAASKKAAKKPDSSGILDFNWLKTKNPEKTTDGLTPPERLRLARNRSSAGNLSPTEGETSTPTDETLIQAPDLRRTPIIPTVPEKNTAQPKVKKTSKLEPNADTGSIPKIQTQKSPVAAQDRPSAQKPKMVIFSGGARKLTKAEEKPLNDLVKFKDNSGSNIFVLGFVTVDPAASNEKIIDNQDLAIARANYVATGLKKRGFQPDQVVVQIVDEPPEQSPPSSSKRRRVEIYFEGATTAEEVVAKEAKPAEKKSRFDFLGGKSFEIEDSGS